MDLNKPAGCCSRHDGGGGLGLYTNRDGEKYVLCLLKLNSVQIKHLLTELLQVIFVGSSRACVSAVGMVFLFSFLSMLKCVGRA
jgi:hypothetical protein